MKKNDQKRKSEAPHQTVQGEATYLTPEGLEKIKKEHEELKNKKRLQAVERLARARELGDLMENAEYSSARDDLMFIDDRIVEFEAILKKAVLISSPKNTDRIQLGSKVVVEVNGEIDEFTIVGTLEADPSRGKISNECLVGKALMGAKVGDEVVVASAVKSLYKIKQIK